MVENTPFNNKPLANLWHVAKWMHAYNEQLIRDSEKSESHTHLL